MLSRTLITALILLWSLECLAQPRHPNAHAHNDYEHARPLLDALANGFASVEADIYLIDGALYVSHHRPKPSQASTLQALYLDPLDSMVNSNVGSFQDQPLLLLVDIKSDASRTLLRLMEVIRDYPRLFPEASPSTYCRVIISGNRDYQLINETPGVFIDGRPDDLGKGYASTKMPLISDHFGNWMHWNGKGRPVDADLQKVRDLARKVHAEGKKLRLWAIPDQEEAWAVLLEAGVDLINTDRLEALNDFLTNWRK